MKSKQIEKKSDIWSGKATWNSEANESKNT